MKKQITLKIGQEHRLKFSNFQLKHFIGSLGLPVKGEGKGLFDSYPTLGRKGSKMARRKPINYEDVRGNLHTNRISKEDEEVVGFFMGLLK